MKMDEIIKDLDIVIITRDREEQLTFNQIPKKIRRYFRFVTNPGAGINLSRKVVPCKVDEIEHNDICELYDKIYRNSIKKYVLIFHDNVSFYSKIPVDIDVKNSTINPIDEGHYSKHKIEELFIEMLSLFKSKLDEGNILVGLHHRAFNLGNEPFAYNSKTFATTAINVEEFYKLNKSELLGNGRYSICEDNVTQCVIANSGKSQIALRDFCFAKPGFNTSGGISRYRTTELIKNTLIQLQEDFGDKYIKIRYLDRGKQHNYEEDKIPHSTIYLSKLYKDNKL